MIWTKATAYGLLAVYEIARRHRGVANPRGIQSADVARKYQLPTAYAAKIMSHLARSGVLHSDRGPNGGFRLNRSPDHISLWDILNGVGGLEADSRKALSGYPAPVQNTLNRAYREGIAHLKETCKNLSIGDML